jgi:hypothetical protein
MSDTPVITPEVVPADPPKRRKRGRRPGVKVSERIAVLKARMEAEKKLPPPVTRSRKVSGLGEQIALVPGGIIEFMKWARGAALRDQRLKPVVDSFSLLPDSRQNAIELESLCMTLGIPPGDLLGACVTIGFERKRDETRLIASLAMPAVMRTNIKQAKLARGVEDRRMFMQSTGILPVPKGSIINVANQANLNVTNDGESSGLPDFEDSVVSFSEVIRNAVEAPRPALPEPVEVISEE